MDDRYRAWAEVVGVDVGRTSVADRDELLAELDALVASLYGLTSEDLRLIFETFHVGWDYQPRLDRTLARFESI